MEYPEVQCVLESLGIDQSCQGKSLEFVCQQMGLEPHFVLKQLHEVIDDDSNVNE
jgi:regulator of cell morphogenesis and NO signaling